MSRLTQVLEDDRYSDPSTCFSEGCGPAQPCPRSPKRSELPDHCSSHLPVPWHLQLSRGRRVGSQRGKTRESVHEPLGDLGLPQGTGCWGVGGVGMKEKGTGGRRGVPGRIPPTSLLPRSCPGPLLRDVFGEETGTSGTSSGSPRVPALQPMPGWSSGFLSRPAVPWSSSQANISRRGFRKRDPLS